MVIYVLLFGTFYYINLKWLAPLFLWRYIKNMGIFRIRGSNCIKYRGMPFMIWLRHPNKGPHTGGHQATEGLAVRSVHLPAGQGVQHRRGGVLPGAMEEEFSVGRRRQDLKLHERVG